MSFSVDIYTPSSIIAKQVIAEQIFVPTCRGEINILPMHTHLMTELEPGIIRLKTKEGDKNFFVTVGLCKVLDQSIKILAYTSESASDIDPERAKKAKELASKKLQSADGLDDEAIIKYRRKIERAELRLKLAYLR
jgi:F-type H+-transporting ATPase subunit epsilon